MKRKALITGIAGQDGSYLTEYLLGKGYEVFGILRRNSIPENQNSRLLNLGTRNFYGDMLDVPSLTRIVSAVMPDEIYNLAAMSHVRISFDMPSYTIQTNALGVLNLLEVYRTVCPNARFYQASSSEMFGNAVDEDGFQRETTPMLPVSPYGCAKLMAFSLVRHYRHAYKLFACNGILFNHESPRRGSNFVTNKVVKQAVEIKLGLRNRLELGNMDSHRDWGHSRDYVRAMHMILSHHVPDDFVIATGETHSVRELCAYVFQRLGMDYQDYVVQNQAYMRPEELKYLQGDASRARKKLGWTPHYTFESMLDEMIDFWLDRTQAPRPLREESGNGHSTRVEAACPVKSRGQKGGR
jgi:GDPmannose 4,6-dehydratase